MFALVSCNTNDELKPGNMTQEVIESIYYENNPWEYADKYQTSWDFDNDGENDVIYFDYSGGAHCCYQITIYTSSDSTYRSFPFEMDGGYVMGVDDSSPEQFYIDDFDKDGITEIHMLVYTYNADFYEIDEKITEQYGFITNSILFDYQDTGFIIKDHIFDLGRVNAY